MGNENLAGWHTQVLPGLTLTPSRSRLRRHIRHGQRVTFRVSDAGTALKGATVRVGKAKGKTNAKGKVELVLGPFSHKGRLRARANLNGYAVASMVLRIR